MPDIVETKNNKKLSSKSSQVNVEEKQIKRLLQYCILSVRHIHAQDIMGRDRKALSEYLGTHKQKRFPGRVINKDKQEWVNKWED